MEEGRRSSRGASTDQIAVSQGTLVVQLPCQVLEFSPDWNCSSSQLLSKTGKKYSTQSWIYNQAGAWCSSSLGRFEHLVLRYPEAVRISNVVVYEKLSGGNVVRISAKLQTARKSADSHTDSLEAGRARKRKRIGPAGVSPTLKDLDDKEWLVLWEGTKDSDEINKTMEKRERTEVLPSVAHLRCCLGYHSNRHRHTFGG